MEDRSQLNKRFNLHSLPMEVKRNLFLYFFLDKIIFRWDPTKTGTGIAFQDDNTKVFLKESAYMFRTVIADTVIIDKYKLAYDVWMSLLGNSW